MTKLFPSQILQLTPERILIDIIQILEHPHCRRNEMGGEVVGGKATQQPVPRDVVALLQLQGDQIAVLAGQVAQLQERLAESDAQRGQVDG